MNSRDPLTMVCLAAAALCIAASNVSIAAAERSYSYADLVKRMNCLERLAVLPEPGDTCRQWSSYDRESKYDEKTGKYVHWDANDDGRGIIRREGNQSVLAEMEGPGCIWRIWSALPDKGRVKIYLDGQPDPVVDMPFADYFDGKHAPFNYPQLSYRLEDVGCRGDNLYFPIPYQKSCKIVAEDKWGAYYHFGYETFPKGTQVPTFSAALAKENAGTLSRVDEHFRNRLGTYELQVRPGEEDTQGILIINQGQTLRMAQLDGPRAITMLGVNINLNDREDQMAALRKVVLKITWDGQKEPAVWCPLGDFFGTAPGVNRYKSLPTGMKDNGFYSFWYMPFAQNAVVELASDDPLERRVHYRIRHAPLPRPFEGLGHFHCKWHRDVFPLPKDRWPDWVMLRTEGRGRFCGVMLHVWNPRGGWWGEGDEKFFVDGEKFPSTIGTGSEDYFGYAWGDPHLFQKPFHCQTMTQNNAGHQSVLRWHIVDNVPFQKSFEGCIEKYYANDRALYACTVFWYLAPGGTDPFKPVPVEQRHGYYVRLPLEAGSFRVIGTPPGDVQTQDLTGFGRGKWQGDDHLWWTGARPGDKLELAIPVAKTGRYRVSAVMTKAIDYGIVQLYLDGKKAGEPVDLYNNGVIPTAPPIPLGVHDLTQGTHKLTVEIVGANPKAVKSYMFGLDYVTLEMEK